jgi:DNA-binding Xre family transcriptional regulator
MGTAIKNNVDKLLKSKGWTRYRLSKESGVTMSLIYSLGGKESGPSADTLLKIADALGCTIDELVR